MPVPYFNYFLGKEKVEPQEKSYERPPQYTPELLKALGFDDPEQVTEQDVNDLEALRESGFQMINFDEKKPQEPSQPNQTPKNQIVPFADRQMTVDDSVTLGFGKDVELGNPLKIEKVAGNVVPSVDEDNDLHVDVIDETKKTPASETLNFFNKIAKSTSEALVQTLQSPITLIDMMGYATASMLGEGDEYNLGALSDEASNKIGFTQARQFLDESLPVINHDSFWGDTVPYGIGSVLYFMAGGMVGNGMKLGTTGSKVLISLLGAGSQSQQMYEDAKNSGASDEEIFINFFGGAGIGASESVLGLGRVFSQIGKQTGKSLVRTVMEGSLEESFQEVAQQLAQNLTVQQTYDLSQSLTEGVVDAGAFALLSGGVFAGMFHKINKGLNDPNLSTEDKIKLSQAQENLKRYEKNLKEQSMVDIKQSYDVGNLNQQEQVSQLNSRLTPTFINSTRGQRVIKNIVRAHNTEGGSSFSAKGRVTSGYSVGIEEGTGKTIQGKKVTEKQIADFIEEKKDLLKNPNNFVGTWYDKDNNVTHIDVSTAVKTEEEAMDLGDQNKQLAIWDFKNKQEIPVVPKSMYEMKKKQDDIPVQHRITLYHYSQNDERGMLTDPKKFGANSFTKNDKKASNLPRTFFFSNPADVQGEGQRFEGANLYSTEVDMRKVYNLSENSQQYGINEYGNIDIDEALRQAKKDGWEGVRYDLGGRMVWNMFNKQYAEKINPTPTMGEIISGKFNKSVRDAKNRLNKGFYGSELGKQLNSIEQAGGMSFRFLTDIGLVMGDQLARKTLKQGTPREFMNRLIETYGETYPLVKRYAREIYEYARQVKDQLKQTPIAPEQMDEIESRLKEMSKSGEFGEYVPTGKGVIILGGDILAHNAQGKQKQLGLGFAKEQALRSLNSKATIKKHSVDGGTIVNIGLKDGKGSVTLLERDYDNSIQIKGSGVNESIKGTGIGSSLYDQAIDYAIANGYKQIESDASLSQDSYNQYQRLKAKGFEVIQSDKVKSEKIGDKTYYRRVGDKGIFTVKLPDVAPNRRGKSYPIWATDLGVAKQISDSASKGNDTVVFMVYPNAWNSVASNYTFQQLVNKQVADVIGENNTPTLPDQENWKNQDVRNKYVADIKKTIQTEIKKGTPREEQAQWKLDNIAYKWGIDNGINLTGKIIGVAKYKQVNFDMTKEGGRDQRIDKHPTYPAEVEGFNYQELDEPIDFNFVKKETEGSDVGVEGNVKELTGAQKEIARKNQMFRHLQQRGLSIDVGVSPLLDALALMSDGDHSKLNQWLQDNPDFAGEIYDYKKHQEWLNDPKRRAEIEKLRIEANKSMEEMYKPVNQKNNQPRDSQGRLPSHPDYEGGTYLASFFDQRTWNSMLAVGKAVGRGAKSFAEFAKKMIQQFGDWIKPALRSIYKGVNQMPNVFKKAGNTEVQHNTQTQEQTAPASENKEEVKKKQLMGRTPSVTTGYNMNKEHPRLNSILDRMLEAGRKEFDERRRGTISNEQLKEEAKRRAEHLTDDDIWNIQSGDIANAESVLAYRIYVLNKLLTNLEEFSKLQEQTDPIDIKQVTNDVANAVRMYEIVRALGTEAGRVVQSFNIPMNDEMVNEALLGLEAMKSLDPDGKMGVGQIQDIIKEVSGQKVKTAQEKAGMMEWIRYIYFNWILQNPLTDIANTFGNFSNLAFHLTANIGNLGGMRTVVQGLKNGFKEGGKVALRIIHGEEIAHSKFSEWIDNADVTSTKKRSWKNYFRLLVPTTRLGIEDAFFRAMGGNIELSRMSYKIGNKIGVAPDEVANAVTRIMNDPDLAKFSRREYQQMAKYVQEIEDELVFQKELGTVGKGFSQISKVAFPIMPFVKTPLNILKFGVSASPFGALKLFKSGLSSEEKNQIIRRALAGSVVMSSIAGMVAQGLVEITGGGSGDPFERDLMEKMGYKPYHLYIKTPFGTYGGSYMNVNPINTPLAVMGDLFDKYRFNKMNNKPDEELAWYDKVAQDMSTALLAVGSSITDQSYLSGVRDLMDALSGRNPDWLMRTLTGYARVGGIQGAQQITGTLDRGRYDTKGRTMEQIQKNSPFMSNEGLIESVSAFGNQRQSQYERFPLPVSEVKENTAYGWMRDNGLRLKIPSKTTKIGNRELNRAEYEVYSKYVGQVMDKAVNQIWEQQNDPELDAEKKLTLEELQDKLDKVYDTAKKKGIEKLKQMILEQYQLNQKGK